MLISYMLSILINFGGYISEFLRRLGTVELLDERQVQWEIISMSY